MFFNPFRKKPRKWTFPDQPNFQRLTAQIIKHEGIVKKGSRHVVYNDSKGIPTIGHGRNLQDTGLSDREAAFLLQNDIREVHEYCMNNLNYYPALDSVRKNVIIELIFNMGPTTWDDFQPTQAHIAAGEYEDAAQHLAAAKWAKDVKSRAFPIIQMMRTGRWP